MNELIKQKNAITTEQFKNFQSVPDKVTRIAFLSLLTTLVQEPFMSSDMKFLVISSMVNKVEKFNFTDEEIKNFKTATKEIVNSFMTTNQFMG